eukprot:262157-Prymnesium_polylepis.1
MLNGCTQQSVVASTRCPHAACAATMVRNARTHPDDTDTSSPVRAINAHRQTHLRRLRRIRMLHGMQKLHERRTCFPPPAPRGAVHLRFAACYVHLL